MTISAGAYTMRAGSKLGISSYDPPVLRNEEGNGDFSGLYAVAGWRRLLQSGSDIEVRAYFDRTDRDDLNYREVRDTVDVDFIHHMPRVRQ